MIYCGEDILSARVENRAQREATAYALGQESFWEEIIVGMADITAKFDPATYSEDEARRAFEHALVAAPLGLESEARKIILPARFDTNAAPDAQMVAEALGITASDFPAWFAAREYRVAMMGFQPGFAYLEDTGDGDLPLLSRLPTPRQKIAAGSIGLLGQRACIYAQDGPGGWPIVGRVTTPLLQAGRADTPFLLAQGMRITFTGGDD